MKTREELEELAAKIADLADGELTLATLPLAILFAIENKPKI